LIKSTYLFGKAGAEIARRLGVKPARGAAGAEIRQEKRALSCCAGNNKKIIELKMSRGGKTTLWAVNWPARREICTTVWPIKAGKPTQRFSENFGPDLPKRRRELPVVNEAATRRRIEALARRVAPALKKYGWEL
jgi:hypothetical protein